jgi:hypothetical protein
VTRNDHRKTQDSDETLLEELDLLIGEVQALCLEINLQYEPAVRLAEQIVQDVEGLFKGEP